MKILKTFIFLNIAIFSLSAQETTMLIDTESSSLNWIGKKITNSQHNGSLKFISGALTMCNDQKTSKMSICKGRFFVDMTTLLVEDLSGSSKQRLEGHLKSDDFFSVDKHKKSFLTINSSKIIESGFKPGPQKQGYVLRRLLRQLYKGGGSIEHPFFTKEVERQEKSKVRYERLKIKHRDKPKEWWFDTHGIDLDEMED